MAYLNTNHAFGKVKLRIAADNGTVSEIRVSRTFNDHRESVAAYTED
ncbi:hypothetical protein GPROT1_01815 [Gammaproteobacteria bacterium]|nr:hypothetical protein GPROT1_01815 [Gammaproteobacteria bacterium]